MDDELAERVETFLRELLVSQSHIGAVSVTVTRWTGWFPPGTDVPEPTHKVSIIVRGSATARDVNLIRRFVEWYLWHELHVHARVAVGRPGGSAATGRFG